MNMPDRIYANDNDEWSLNPDNDGVVEYIRADIADRRQAAAWNAGAEAMREKLARRIGAGAKMSGGEARYESLPLSPPIGKGVTR